MSGDRNEQRSKSGKAATNAPFPAAATPGLTTPQHHRRPRSILRRRRDLVRFSWPRALADHPKRSPRHLPVD